MNLFIGCSSHEELDEKYKENTRKIVSEIAKIKNINLIIGTANDDSGLMGIAYHEFRKNRKKIHGITLEQYKDLPPLEMDEVTTVKTTMDRCKNIYQKSDAILFLPGALGTYSEIFSFLTELVEKNDNKLIILYNKDFFFTPIIQNLHNLYKQKFISKEISEYCIIESVEKEVISLLKNYIEINKKEG